MPWTFYDGSGNKLNTVATSGVLQNVVEDLTPQLGANLDLNGFNLAFPATQTADAGANVLDDYEEGTFTPQIADATGDGSGEGQVYGQQVGTYTKIGDRVFGTFVVEITNLGTLTGANSCTIVGWPFATVNNASERPVFSIEGSSLALTAGYNLIARAEPNTSIFGVQVYNAASGIYAMTITELSVNGTLRGVFQYRV